MPIVIRSARVEDAPVLCTAERETSRTPGLLVSHSDELLPDAYASLIATLTGGSGCYLVAMESDRIVGHAFLEPMRLRAIRHVFRLTVVVHPGCDGRGVGTALMGALADWARRTPAVHKVELNVRSTNERARRLYARFGFVEEGRFRDRVRLADGSHVDDMAMAWFPKRQAIGPSPHPQAGLDIRRLDVSDAHAFVALRAEALDAEPLAFGSSPADDIGLKIDSVRTFLADRETQGVFGHFDGAELWGSVGLVRMGKAKQRHRASIWGMYVRPHRRHRGIGRALLDAAVAQAGQWKVEQVQLSVTEAAPAARRLYEGAGFREWGRESRALCWNGQFADEYHLVLHLDP